MGTAVCFVSACPPSHPPCTPESIDNSLVIHDQATITAADFSFARTVAAIRASSGGAATTDEAMLQTLLDSLTASSYANPISGLPMPVNIRNVEAARSASALLAGEMKPIALFNRFDLMPADGSNCGEYRIVYARYPNELLERFLMIFEAKLPNPTPAAGRDGCLPVANFWHSLSDPNLNTQGRAALIASFYYAGLPGFSAVVQHANYGVPLGQVRANMFSDLVWELREWRTSYNYAAQPVFAVDTDKQNPLAEFFNESSSSDPLFASEQGAFLYDFTAVQMPIIGNNSVPFPVSARCDAANAISSQFPQRFNEFMSVPAAFLLPQPDPDNHRKLASANFSAAVTGAMGSLPFTADQMLNRSMTQTCAGCHNSSNATDIGFGQTWPSSGIFVHAIERPLANGTATTPPPVTPLSPALTECFLPLRKAIIEDFVCTHAPPPASPDAGVSAAPEEEETAVSALQGEREEELLAVDRARTRFLSAESSFDRKLELGRLNAAIEAAREHERGQPGAFVEHRRAH